MRFAVPRCVLILGTGRSLSRLLGRTRGARLLPRARAQLRARRENHEHVLAFEARFALDVGIRCHVLRHPIQKSAAEVRVRNLAAAEHDGYFDFIAFAEQSLSHLRLHLVIVAVDFRAKLDLAKLVMRLLLARFFVFLRLLVFQTSVIDDPAYGWNRCGRNLDEVESFVSCNLEGLFRRHHAELLPFVVDQADLADADLFVDSERSSDERYSFERARSTRRCRAASSTRLSCENRTDRGRPVRSGASTSARLEYQAKCSASRA